MNRVLLIVLCVLSGALPLVSCGVKSDLEPPSGAAIEQDEPDPSRPPQPLGQ